MIEPSCPVCVVHDDDAFRRALIASLDQRHFTVTFIGDGDEAVEVLRQRAFRVVIVCVAMKTNRGFRALEYLRTNRNGTCGVIVLGDPDPEIRNYTKWVDETLLKPVDPDYVATRARAYCAC
ncbi:MAG TPA: response regulator [Thermoanaerobaculia bacterium]|nr:response regulator [Thermoanaerobaculia bacterium]